MNKNLTPHDFGLDHEAWRPGQMEAIETISAKWEAGQDTGDQSFTIIEAPTGTGKSAIAFSLAAYARVTVLVGTLNLLDQYRKEYGFDGIKGRNNYPCAHPGKVKKWMNEMKSPPTAADCHYGKMFECPASEMCKYLAVKKRALASQKLVVTYAYASLSYPVRERSGFLVMDEGHLAAEHLLQFAEFTISQKKQRQRGFPNFPKELWLYGEKKKGGLVTPRIKPFIRAYLKDCMDVLDEKMQYMSPLESEYSRLNQEWERLGRMSENLDKSTWFLDCHAYVARSAGRDIPGLRLRALDARTVADRLWESKQDIVLMSATIGDPEPLADKLGITDFEFMTFPHPVPLKYRPVEDLGIKRMTHRNLQKWPSLFRVQSLAIAQWIDKIDPGANLRGIVLTSSYKKIQQLHEGMKLFLPDRRYAVQDGSRSIDQISKSFLADPRPGDILIASIQGFGQGLNLKGDLARFVVIAGLPHDNPSDPYAQALKSQPGGAKYAWNKAYASVPQAAGRVNRGTLQDNGEYLTNWTAIADGSALSPLALKYYPTYFLNAIKEDKNETISNE